MRNNLKSVLALALAVSTFFGAVPVSASESNRALQTLERIVPGILKETNAAGRLRVVELTRDSGVGSVRLASKGAIEGQSISLIIDYAKSQRGTKQGLVVLDAEDPSVSAVAQEMGNGFRVLTTIASKPVTNRYSYSFDVSSSARLLENSNGYLVVDGSTVLGSLDEPWAIDADGNRVKTHYEWSNSVLTQVIDEGLEKISYPLVLDPAWGYVFQYDLSFSPATNMSRLKTCFNCYFPVSGAPKNYPKPGQLLPLSVGIFNFECRMASTVETPSYGSFQFNATANHVDGYGSNIIFQFMKIGGRNYLVVDAYIVNSLDLIRAPYLASAGLNWQVFAWNLNSPTPRT
ncbi:MAG: hypothetical protein RJA66_866 [Actinomycetota bacterium]|jgi:hypothetical protein